MRRFAALALAVFATCCTSSHLSAQTKVLFLTRHRTTAPVTLKAADPQILSFLEQRYGASNVTWMSSRPDLLVPPEPALVVDDPRFYGYDAVVISSTIESGDLRGLIHETTCGIVNLEAALARPISGEFHVVRPAGTYPIFEVEPAHGILVRTAHPITAGLPLNVPVPICSASAEVWWSETIAPGAVDLASDDDTPANGFLTYVEFGSQLHNAQTATCRRVMFGMGDSTFASLNATGQQIFGQAVDWAAANCCAQVANYGTGLAGTNGVVPTIGLDARPVFGTTVNLLLSNSSGQNVPCLLILGTTAWNVPFLGGELLTSITSQVAVPLTAAGTTLPLGIPHLGYLCNRGGLVPEIYLQALQLDGGAPFQVSMTDGLRLQAGR